MDDTPRPRADETGDNAQDALPGPDERSDWKVVLQFFLVPLSLVVVLVSVFFGLQVMRSRRPGIGSALRSLQSYRGFLARYVGDIKRWQSGYDLSLLVRGSDPDAIRRTLPELGEAFREASKDHDVKLRQYLALVLGESKDPRGVAPLREGLRDGDSLTRLFSCWGLAEIGDRGALPDLRAAAADPDPGVRKMAIFALGRLGDWEARPLLRAALQDPQDDVRWNAALALSRFGDRAAVPVLVALLEGSIAPAGADETANRRDRALNAIRGLALLGGPEARGPLRRAASVSSDPQVQQAARLALRSTDPETAARLP